MSAVGKYQMIEVDTLESRKRYRALIEDRLRNEELTPELRFELEQDLKYALIKEHDAYHDLEKAEAEEEEEKKKKDGGESGEEEGGSGGGQQEGSGGSGGGMKTSSDEAHDDAEIETIALLFVMACQDIEGSREVDSREVVGAATLLYDSEEGLAQVDEPYTLAPPGAALVAGEFLAALEDKATRLGASTMQLKVQPNAVDQFKARYGYEPRGKVYVRGGTTLQRMRKSLAPQPVPDSDA